MEKVEEHFLVRLQEVLLQLENTKCLAAKFTSTHDGLVIFDIDKLVLELSFSSKEELVKHLQRYFCWSSLPGNVVQCSSAIGGGGYYWKLDGFSKCCTENFLKNVPIRQTVEEQPRPKRKPSTSTEKPSKKTRKEDGVRKRAKKIDRNVLVLNVPDAKKERFLRYVSVASSLESIMGSSSLKTRTSIILSELQNNETLSSDTDKILLKAVLFFSTELNRLRQILKISSSSKLELVQYREKFITDYERSFLEYTIGQMKKYKDTFEKYLESSSKTTTIFSFSETLPKEEVIRHFLLHYIPQFPFLESEASRIYKLHVFEREKTSINDKIESMNARFQRPELPYLAYDETFLQHLQNKEGCCTCSLSPHCEKYSSTFSEVYRKSLLCRTMQETGHCISEKCCVWLLHFFQEHSFSCVSETCSVPGCISRKLRHQKKCFRIASCKYKCCTLQAKRKIESIFLAEEEEEEEEDMQTES